MCTAVGAASLLIMGRSGELYGSEALNARFLLALRAVGYWTVSVILLLVVLYFFHASDRVSRGWVAIWFVLGAGCLGLLRIVLRARIASWRSRGWMRKRVVVIGTHKAAADLAVRLEQQSMRDIFDVVGIFHDRGAEKYKEELLELDTAGSLVQFVRENKVEVVLICPGLRTTAIIESVSRELTAMPIDVLLCPDTSSFPLPVISTASVGDLWLFQVSSPPLSDWARVVKGVEDRVIAGAMLFIFSPLMLAAALAIKIDSRGTIFFQQERFGFNNHPIKVLKFRTMHSDRCDPTGAARTVQGDRRVTRVGRVLRKASIDELPQLLNVLSGEMSLVGPRAHATKMKVSGQFYHEAIEGYVARHRVKPGITGLAQVNGFRGEVDTMEKAEARIRYDLNYISRWSLWLDLRIMALTVRSLLNGY
jgi:Undecaprenyl-phosphate glucose phosphotransferase